MMSVMITIILMMKMLVMITMMIAVMVMMDVGYVYDYNCYDDEGAIVLSPCGQR